MKGQHASPELSDHSTTIYQDCLFVFGVNKEKERGLSLWQMLNMTGIREEEEVSRELWCFDLSIFVPLNPP